MKTASPVYAATIKLSGVEQKAELGLGIITDHQSVVRLAELLFGDASLAEDEEMLFDILSESANICMGDLKSAFVKDGIPWAHIDIAGAAWGAKAKDYYTGGATGTAVRTLLHWVRGL